MMNQRRTSSTRRRSGHVILEMALGFMPFCALIFGIADFSMVVYINSNLENAVREGVRYGITYNTTFNSVSYATQTAAITEVVEAHSGGWITDANSSTYVQVNYYAPGALSTPVTGSTANASGNVIEVKIQNFPWNWMVPLPNYMQGRSLNMNMSALDVLPSVPAGTTLPSP